MEATLLTIRHFHDGQCDVVARAQLNAALAGEGYVWVDLLDPTDDEAVILHDDLIALDALLVEDMIEDRHLPKLDVLADQFLLTVHGMAVVDSTVKVRTEELDILVRGDLVVTYHSGAILSVQHVQKRLEVGANEGLERPALLVHRILDVMADVYLPFLDLLEQRTDLVEEDILELPSEATRREIYQLQRDVIQLRRVVVPQTEVLRRLAREADVVFEPGDSAYFRDVYDHLYRIAEFSDSLRQLLDRAMDNYRSALNDELNRVLKVLTIFSAVLLPVSVVAGIYGTNFEFLPELQYRWAYPAMWGLFAVIVVGELLFFRSRGWIGRRVSQQQQDRRLLAEVLDVPVLGQVLKVPAYGARAVIVTGKVAVKVPGLLARMLTRRRRDA